MPIALNTSQEMGTIIQYLTINVTGDIFLSLFAFIIVIFALAFAARIPIEWTAVVVFPMLLATVAITNRLLPVLGVTIIYASILLAKNFFYK